MRLATRGVPRERRAALSTLWAFAERLTLLLIDTREPLTGQIKLACDNFPVAWEQIQAGKLRAISITSLQPFPLSPAIETTAKTLPGFEMMPAFGWVGPANMPADITKKLIDELVAIGKLPEVRAAMEKFGVIMVEQAGPAYADALKKERDMYSKVIEKAGIKVQ